MSEEDPISRIRFLLASGKKSLLTTLFLLVSLPVLIVAGLTVRNIQKPDQLTSSVQIIEASGNPLTTTESPNISIKITLPSGSVAPSSTSAYAQEKNLNHVLKTLTIENKDTDGSSGGNMPLIITSSFHNYLDKPIKWRLNDLAQGQDSASRNIQVSLTDTNMTTTILSATITLNYSAID